MIWQKGKLSISMIGSLVVSILVCVLTSMDIFPMVGLSIALPYVGSVLTGIVVARGSNFVNELFTRLKGEKING